jgi:HSF-type DNA-binding
VRADAEANFEAVLRPLAKPLSIAEIAMEPFQYADRCSVTANEDDPKNVDHAELTKNLGAEARKTAETAFPSRLYQMLGEVERAGDSNIISWDGRGESFIIYEPKMFAETWMQRCFNQSKYKSFQRQLNLYNFQREPKGKIKGVCKLHPCCL